MKHCRMETPKRRRRTKQEIINDSGEVGKTVPPAKANTKSPTKTSSKKKATQPTVALVTANGIQGSFSTFSKTPLIVHLDIKSADVIFYDQPIYYNADMKDLLKEPEPYDASTDDIFISSAEPVIEQSQIQSQQQTQIQSQQQLQQSTNQSLTSEMVDTQSPSVAKDKEYVPQVLLMSFSSSDNSHILPEQTDIFCHWCHHPFEGHPCVIPISCSFDSEAQPIWKGYGNFCSPSCGLSYLLAEKIDNNTLWERNSLLNRLYHKQGYVYPAPPWQTLKVFGGIFTITEFRDIIDKRRVRVDITLPPIVSILASMDTKPIDFYQTSMKNTSFGGNSYGRGGDEGLKLKRTKPLKDRENTLDSILNIGVK